MFSVRGSIEKRLEPERISCCLTSRGFLW